MQNRFRPAHKQVVAQFKHISILAIFYFDCTQIKFSENQDENKFPGSSVSSFKQKTKLHGSAAGALSILAYVEN